MSNISTTTTLDVIYNLSTFKDRLEKLEKESAKKGTTDGINHEIEYYANVANAVVYTATDFLTGAALEKFLKDYTDMLKISESLSEYTGNAIGNKVRSYLYDNINEFNTFNLPSPENTIPQQQIDNSTLFNIEKNVYDSWNNNFLSDTYYTNISKNITNYLVNSNPTGNYANLVNSGYFNNSTLNPINIGAFYESSTSQIDNSVSIAKQTFKLLNSSNQTITKSQLIALDVNKDGKLSGTEITTLKTWKDLNEDGIAQSGEIITLSETIYSKDYDTYTKGNSVFQNPISPTQAVKQSATYATPISNYKAVINPTSNYSTITKTVSVPVVPNSNYDTLRNSDNVYYLSNGGYIGWSVNQVKINNSNRSYMIGTAGNDSFDYRYYQATGYFDVNVLRNFLGGAGDDQIGGSNYADNIWGGIGNDTLYGYDGDDNVYGEDGNDVLLGQNGNDKLFSVRKVNFIKSKNIVRFYQANLKEVA